MSDSNKYLKMQKGYYNNDAAKWNLTNKDPVVGAYHAHNKFDDYDTLLFKDIDTKNLIALEYGCGPGRNILRFNDRFKRIDGVDISPVCIDKAKVNIEDSGIDVPNLLVTSGDNIPAEDSTYDVVFSTICLQHICVHEIRYAIMKDIRRVLKDGGYFCAQMGIGVGGPGSVGYYDNNYTAQSTNGFNDTTIGKEEYLTKDLEKIGFKNYKSDIGATVSDRHDNWIWFKVEK